MRYRPPLLLSCLAIALAAPLAAEPEIYTVVDQRAEPLRTPPPEYPRQLLIKKVSGIVLLSVVINDQGNVEETEVLKSSESGFENATVEAVKTWRFRPAKKDGNAVWSRVKLPIQFTPPA